MRLFARQNDLPYQIATSQQAFYQKYHGEGAGRLLFFTFTRSAFVVLSDTYVHARISPTTKFE